MKPIIPWIGGKRRLAKYILPLFPAHTCYVEVFCGGGALFFMRQPAEVEVINDINGELVNLYRVVQHHLEEFCRQFKWALLSRQMFRWLQDTDPATLTDIQRAARFYYLQKMSFGAKVAGQTFGTATTTAPKINLLRLEEELSTAHQRLAGVLIEHLDWSDCISRYDRPHTLFYCDPPYWGTEGYGVGFGLEQYTRMAEVAKSMQGRVIISVNDIPEMRQAFSGLSILDVGITYTVGGGDKASAARELVIANFEPLLNGGLFS